MRKITATVLASLLLFNVLGFYGIIFSLRYQNQERLSVRLDRGEYERMELFTFKVPLSVPYATDQQEYQRVDGEFQHEGDHYRLVKQRLASDTLFVVCVKDQQSKRIQQALSDYVQTMANDLSHEKNGATLKLDFSKDFYGLSFSLLTQSYGWEQLVVQKATIKSFIPTYSSYILHPPENI